MVRVLQFIGFFLLVISVNAQDIHFTQYQNSPINLNPANTGRFEGDWRFVGNYRTQWRSIMDDPFSTTSVAFDKQFNVFGHHVSGGAQFAHDNAGTGNLSTNRLMISGGYHKSVKRHHFSGGIQLGFTNRGVNLTSLSLPDQFDMGSGSFNSSMPTAESLSNQRTTYFDANFGVFWEYQLTKKIRPKVGFAQAHFNRPNESFFGEDNPLEPRNMLTVAADYQLDSLYTLTPEILSMTQNEASELLVGGTVTRKLEKNPYHIKNVFGGITYRDGFVRNNDAFALVVGGQIKQYRVGVSYDFNVSELSNYTNYRGAFEISIIYIAERIFPNVLNIPCDRY